MLDISRIRVKHAVIRRCTLNENAVTLCTAYGTNVLREYEKKVHTFAYAVIREGKVRHKSSKLQARCHT